MDTHDSSLSLSTVIACGSLVLSLITLYLANLRPAAIRIVSGPNIKVYYPPDGGFGLYLPIAFINTSSATGTVYRVGVSLARKADGASRYFFEWRNFTGTWDGATVGLSEPAHALAVAGNKTQAKILWMSWRSASVPELVLQTGEYSLVVHVWLKRSGKPFNQMHTLFVEDSDRATLDRFRATHNGQLVDMTLDRDLPPNRFLTGFEAASLLGLEKS